MIKIEVKDPKPTVRTWTDKTTNQPRSMRIQNMLVYLANNDGIIDGTYDKIEHILGENQPSFAVGMYEITPACFYLDRNGRLQVGLSRIAPVTTK